MHTPGSVRGDRYCRCRCAWAWGRRRREGGLSVPRVLCRRGSEPSAVRRGVGGEPGGPSRWPDPRQPQFAPLCSGRLASFEGLLGLFPWAPREAPVWEHTGGSQGEGARAAGTGRWEKRVQPRPPSSRLLQGPGHTAPCPFPAVSSVLPCAPCPAALRPGTSHQASAPKAPVGLHLPQGACVSREREPQQSLQGSSLGRNKCSASHPLARLLSARRKTGVGEDVEKWEPPCLAGAGGWGGGM